MKVRDGTHVDRIAIMHPNVAPRSRIDRDAVIIREELTMEAYVSWRIVEVTLSGRRGSIAHAASIMDGDGEVCRE